MWVTWLMNRILCGGIMIGLVLVARPAMASADLGVGTEVGAGWSEQRVDKVSRDEVMRPIGTTRAPNKAVSTFGISRRSTRPATGPSA